eukprot:TRINITY_DN5908_c0_g1_i1.p1 TRINITY_DN5908_c0_g1~~TRINITY_DN5908_c0_g1_i1.p1  ORF type:complete len:434 (+),score=40.38 TRINITY_DN5908_c0_g1_i1:63-1304(+)
MAGVVSFPVPVRGRIEEEIRNLVTQRRCYLQLQELDGARMQASGTVPIENSGVSYHTPVTVWFDRDYPARAPVVQVDRTESLVLTQVPLRKYQLNQRGQVMCSLLQNWNSQNTLRDLISELRQLFGAEPPLRSAPQGSTQRAGRAALPNLASRTTQHRSPSSGTGPTEAVQRVLQQLAGFADQARVKRDAVEALQKFSALRAEPVGRTALGLMGTLKVTYAGGTYNIPVAVHMLHGYPAEARFMVRPTENMQISRQAQYVDAETGDMTPAVMSTWSRDSDRLVSAVARMRSLFEEAMPVFAVPAQQRHSVSRSPTTAAAPATQFPPLGAKPEAKTTSAELVARLEAEVKPQEAEDSKTSCVICFENKKDQLLLPCKHICLCGTCVVDLLKRSGENAECPLCRKRIEDVMTVYS